MKMLIGGKWINKQETFDVRNPFNNELIDTVPKADSQDVEMAMQCALSGFETMRSMPGYKRASILKIIRELLEQKA